LNEELNLFAEKKLRGVPLFGLNYLNRVKNYCEKFSIGMDFDKNLLELSLMLHCIESKKLIDFGIDFHSASAVTAKKFLINSNQKKDLTDKTVHCILNAGIDGKPELIEGKILQNAVLAEFLGSTGIVYALYVSGIKKSSSRTLIMFLQNFLIKVNSVDLLNSSKKVIFERKKVFESFLSELVNDFS
jgi:HD superfamily phosphodiesterase